MSIKNSVLVLFIWASYQTVYACSPAPEEQASSIAEKVENAEYVFSGTVNQVNEDAVVVSVHQYFKNEGPSEVKVSGFNTHSCSDFLSAGQTAVFFAEGDILSTLTAVYDGAFGSVRSPSISVFKELSATKECMASFENGVLSLPCVAIPDLQQTFNAELAFQNNAFELTAAEAKTSIVSKQKKAPVDHVEVQILESFPVQVNVVASGSFPNGCGRLDQTMVDFNDSVFSVFIGMKTVGEICTLAFVPFSTTVSLPVAGLKAGEYQVIVNDVSTRFNLEMDN